MLVRVPEDGAGGEEVPVLGAGVQGTLETHLPVLERRLYLSSSSASESVQPAKDEIFVTMHKRMNYVPFCADFGPLNLGATCQMCRKLRVLLASPNLQGSKIVYCTSQVWATLAARCTEHCVHARARADIHRCRAADPSARAVRRTRRTSPTLSSCSARFCACTATSARRRPGSRSRAWTRA